MYCMLKNSKLRAFIINEAMDKVKNEQKKIAQFLHGFDTWGLVISM